MTYQNDNERMQGRQVHYFAVPEHPMEVTLVRGNGAPSIKGGALLDLTFRAPRHGTGGMRALMAAAPRFDEHVFVHISNGPAQVRLEFAAVVRTVRPTESNDHSVVGLVVEDDVPQASLDLCVSRQVLTRRNHVRHPVLLSAKAQFGDSKQLTDVEIHDISFGGFCIATHEPHQNGTPLRIFLSEPDLEVEVSGEVRWQAFTGSEFMVGCMLNGGDYQDVVSRIIDFYNSVVVDPESDRGSTRLVKKTSHAGSGGLLGALKFWKR